MDQKNRRRLRHLLINGDLQMRLFSYSLIYVGMAFLVALSFGLYPLFRDMFASNNEAVQYHAAMAFLALLQRLVPATLLLLAVFVVHMLVIYHRIGGPLTNFTRTFQSLADGDLSRKVSLRRSDYLKVQGDHINRMIDALGTRFEQIQTDYRQLSDELGQLEAAADNPQTRRRLQDALNIVTRGADRLAVRPPGAASDPVNSVTRQLR